jgi:glycosyltransferase involved in cell wall biosynthesis
VKILIANTLYHPDTVGGAEISTRLLAEGLVKAGMDVCVVCATGTGVDRVSTLNGVKIYHLRSVNLYWPHQPKNHSPVVKMIWHAIDVHNVIMSRKLKNIIAREKPDIINTSNLACLSIDIWRVARNAGVPIVHTARDYYLMCPTATMFTRAKPCQRQCGMCSLYAGPKRAASAQVEVAVAVSRFVLQKHLENGYFQRAARTEVISNCYLPFDDTPPVQRVRENDSVPVKLGVLGRLSPEKGLEVLLEQLLADKTLNWTLSIGGKGDDEYVKGLQTKYADPRIDYLGHVKSGAFLDSIDVLVVPSIWNEPFGRVTVEAYSRGVPVVGANTGGIPEVIEPESNLLFDMARPETLITKLREATEWLKDPTLHDRLRKHADTFSLSAMVDAYLDVYQSALASRALRLNHVA